jgi:plastocyanin
MKGLMSAFGAMTLGVLCGIAIAAQGYAQGGGAVTIANFKFAPETVSVAPNAPVTWTNNDGAPHQIVVGSKKLTTAVISKGQSAQLRIAEAGTYDYVCGIHPTMKGKIAVK